MKALAIVLVGGAAKIAADGFFGVLALLRLLLQGERAASIFFFARVPPSKLCLERRRERATALLQRR